MRIAAVFGALLLALATVSAIAPGGQRSPGISTAVPTVAPSSALDSTTPSRGGNTPVPSVVVSSATPVRSVVVGHPTPATRSQVATVTPIPDVPAPRMHPHPSARTKSSISVRFDRAPAPDLVCKPNIGYELKGGAFGSWHDVGGFPGAPCDDPDPGYKFNDLAAGRSYTLSIRAYRLAAGVKKYSQVSSVTASTLG